MQELQEIQNHIRRLQGTVTALCMRIEQGDFSDDADELQLYRTMQDYDRELTEKLRERDKFSGRMLEGLQVFQDNSIVYVTVPVIDLPKCQSYTEYTRLLNDLICPYYAAGFRQESDILECTRKENRMGEQVLICKFKTQHIAVTFPFIKLVQMLEDYILEFAD